MIVRDPIKYFEFYLDCDVKDYPVIKEIISRFPTAKIVKAFQYAESEIIYACIKDITWELYKHLLYLNGKDNIMFSLTHYEDGVCSRVFGKNGSIQHRVYLKKHLRLSPPKEIHYSLQFTTVRNWMSPACRNI